MSRADSLRRPRRTTAVSRLWRARPGSASRRNVISLGYEVLEPRAMMSAAPWGLNLAWLASRASSAVEARLSATPADTAGDTLATARTLNVSAGSVSVQESLSTRDANDFFRFTLSADSRVSLSVTGLSRDANLQLARDANNNRTFDGADVLATSANRGTANESIGERQLAAGTYYARVYYAGGNTNYSLSIVSRIVTPPPSNPANPPVAPTNRNTTTTTTTTTTTGGSGGSSVSTLGLFDPGIAALTQTLFVDGSLSRSDMISILRSAGSDDSRVDAVELADFRKILTNATQYKLQDHVRGLAGYVVNGNQANASFQGQALGNLADGSTAVQLNKLVDKWFLGADRPNAGGYGYQAYAGQLFVNGASYTDIRQGQVGDCYLVASFAAIAKSAPSAISSMLMDNGDSTYTARFYRSNGTVDYVTVDRQLPTGSWGGPIFAGVGTTSAGSASNELWVALLEKAYVQWNETGGTGRTDARNAYQAIAGGWMNDVYRQTLGRYGAAYVNWTDSYKSIIVDAVLQNKVVTLGSRSGNPGNGVVGGHAYVLTGYNTQNGTFTCYNPWGTSHPSPLSWTQLKTSFLAACIA